MRITKIDYMKVFVPWQASFKEPMREWRARGGTTPEEEDAYVIVQVYTDEGLVGLGEGERSIEKVRSQGETFIGKNPLELNPYHLHYPFVHAIFDIIGQALGVPVYRLLGGKHRDRVPVAYWSPYLPPHETAKHAEEGKASGFTVHKIKARPWDAVRQVKAMTAAAGDDYAIRIDPNETFQVPATTVRIDRELEGYNVECFEDPVPKAHIEWYPLLRQKCRIPIAIHQGNPHLIFEAAKREAMDYVNIGGSPLNTIRAAAVAEMAGCPVWIQNEGHCLDIAAAFDAHIGAAIPNATLPYDTLHFIREGSIAENPLVPKDGFLPVPTEPGLGVKLDKKAMERYRIG
jgi:L-alanine-DL-glutamate epimerase-like enolase superfamily enzyme